MFAQGSGSSELKALKVLVQILDVASEYLKDKKWINSDDGWKTCIRSFVEANSVKINPASKSTKFLNYDSMHLIRTYFGETPVAGVLPYTEIVSFIDKLRCGKLDGSKNLAISAAS
jgi:hypothetical protein